MTSAGVRSRLAQCCRPGSGVSCRLVWKRARRCPEAAPSSWSSDLPCLSSWPRRPCLRMHPSRSTLSPPPLWMTSCTLSLKSVLPVWREAICSWWVPLLTPCPTSTWCPAWEPLFETVPSLPTAGLCLCDNAAVGLCPVPGYCGHCRGAAGGPGSGLRPWALCPARYRLQCCHYPGIPGLQGRLGCPQFSLLSPSSCLPLCPSRCCPS